MPSWTAVGGERLVRTAKAAGASALLLNLRQICRQGAHGDSGPYSDAVRADDVLQCMERFAQHDILAEWVRPGQGLKLHRSLAAQHTADQLSVYLQECCPPLAVGASAGCFRGPLDS